VEGEETFVESYKTDTLTDIEGQVIIQRKPCILTKSLKIHQFSVLNYFYMWTMQGELN
jgi:hypothetical protein